MMLRRAFLIALVPWALAAGVSSCDHEGCTLPDVPVPGDTTRPTDTTRTDTIVPPDTTEAAPDTTRTDTVSQHGGHKGGGVGIDDSFGDTLGIRPMPKH